MVPRKNNYKLSPEFINKVAEITAGYISPEMFDSVIGLFESEISAHYFTFSSESNLLRIISAMYDKAALLSECVKYPHYVEILVSISSNSNYLTDILVRNPEYFYWIVNPSTLEYKIELQQFPASIKNIIKPFKSFSAKVNALRRLKRKEILRIGTKDILGKSNLEETTEELSILAKAITAELFDVCYSETLNKYSLNNIKRKYCLIALGKLGGNELNYSSDIDLIIFYDQDSTLSNKKRYSEILTEAIYLFIECASSITSSGYIYRIDFRLRPDGRNSPLCRPLNEHLMYYESRGEDWERQMLIKMDFVAGSRSLYNTFADFLRPFIYPNSFTISPTEQIKKLKSEIENNLNDEENIKLIPGGIRDIEFSIQALQLINGGRNKNIRASNSMEAIEKLSSSNLISAQESETLSGAYVLYRRIEHYLQLMNDSQTHTIPQDGEMLDKLSAYFGYKSSAEFKKFVFDNRKAVAEIYNSIMSTDANKKLDRFAGINFVNKTKFFKDLQFLREGKGLLGQKQFDKGSVEYFQKIEPVLLNYLQHSIDPDRVLQNFVRVIRQISFPSIWYREFEDKKFFESFLKLCEFSQFSIDLFAEDEDLREYFLTRKVFEKIILTGKENFSARMILFITSAQFALDLITPQKVSKTLKNYFDEAIKLLSEQILNQKIQKSGYAVLAMGSLGSGEMTFTSDIDLIFVVNNLTSDQDVQKEFQALLIKLKEVFKPIDVDCRLRPEGKSSMLVWDLQSYRDYVLTRARTWELQAFCKLDFIAGNNKIFNLLLTAARQRIKKLKQNNLQSDILEMRKKLYPSYAGSILKSFNIKRSAGGITDIEFLIQYVLLSDFRLFTKYRGKRIDEIISSLIKNNKKNCELRPLNNNYIFLKNLELANQILFGSSTAMLPSAKEKISAISLKLNYADTKEFQDQLSKIIKEDYLVFKKYLS